MRKIRVLLAACVLSATSLLFAAPAQAMTCEDELEDACRTAAVVICGVVAKGRPCLN